jgi:hypothetical protein
MLYFLWCIPLKEAEGNHSLKKWLYLAQVIIMNKKKMKVNLESVNIWQDYIVKWVQNQ